MDNNKNTIITIADAKKTLEEAIAKYRNGEIKDSFACSVKEALICKNILRHMGVIVTASYEDGKGGYTDKASTEMIRDYDLTGYITFNPVKKATFLKKDAKRAWKWRLMMFDEGYRWVENPYNPKAKVVDYTRAQRYYFDILKKIFWVVDLGG